MNNPGVMSIASGKTGSPFVVSGSVGWQTNPFFDVSYLSMLNPGI